MAPNIPDASNATAIISYSPADFVGRYQNIEINDVSVSINKYMIGVHADDDGARRRNAVRAAADKKRLIVNKAAFLRASMGKVSPDDCEHILGLAVESGAVKETALQDFANKALGVDCTGFAVAYLDAIGRIDINKYSGGAGCHFLVDRAFKGLPQGTSPLIWDADEARVGDMIVWMTSKRIETRKPGHIALISSSDVLPGSLVIAESSGAGDGFGHSGPKNNTKTFDGVKQEGGARYISLNGKDKVIIVRPPASFG